MTKEHSYVILIWDTVTFYQEKEMGKNKNPIRNPVGVTLSAVLKRLSPRNSGSSFLSIFPFNLFIIVRLMQSIFLLYIF